MHRAVSSTDDQAVVSLAHGLLRNGQGFLGIVGESAIRRGAELFDSGQKAGENPSSSSAPRGRVDDNVDFHLLPGKGGIRFRNISFQKARRGAEEGTIGSAAPLNLF